MNYCIVQTRLWFLFCLTVTGCSSDLTQGLADGGEQDVADDSAVEPDTSIVPDTGTVPDVGADLVQNLPGERIPCFPNVELVVCDNTRRGLGFEPTDTGSLFPWDCIEVGSLYIEWSGDPVDGPPPTEFPDLEQLTPLESAGIEMAVVIDPHDSDSDFYPLNLG